MFRTLTYDSRSDKRRYRVKLQIRNSRTTSSGDITGGSFRILMLASCTSLIKFHKYRLEKTVRVSRFTTMLLVLNPQRPISFLKGRCNFGDEWMIHFMLPVPLRKCRFDQ